MKISLFPCIIRSLIFVQSSWQHSSVEASRACVHEVVSSNPGGAYFFFNLFSLFFNALVISYFIQTDMSNFFSTFSNFSIFFSTCSQHVPNLFPIFHQLFPNFFSNFLEKVWKKFKKKVWKKFKNCWKKVLKNL